MVQHTTQSKRSDLVREPVRILGVNFTRATKSSLLKQCVLWLNGGRTHIIFTPNPEMLVDAYRWSWFRRILNRSDANLADGVGVQWASGGMLQRIPGSDFVQDLCSVAARERRSVFLLGTGSETRLQDAAANMQNQYPHLQIAGMHPGPAITLHANNADMPIHIAQHENETLLEQIRTAAPEILFVGFGHAKQEAWIMENKDRLRGVKIIMGVGGTLDFLAGSVRRAPRWMRRFGLEWLWRLILQPRRLPRILKATIVFPLLFIYNKIKQKFSPS